MFVKDVRDAMVANCQMARSMNVERPSVVDSIYHLGPTELISEIDGAIACTPLKACCVYGRINFLCFLTYLLGRFLGRPSSLSQTKGCVGTRKVVRNHPESITKWTLERNLTGSYVEYAG
ncbi:hypothetical protein GOBAR_AA11630 [Gossypium barbadense]|uniref:Uncharacterized protein n=1 Tax=Gossypium barbadense TaxID=3634 RepID=A0A2P5Y0B5_GOSBA|nr:hypothetical protein GOBAR_AA11630 [Gossypium barbadense]